MAQDKATIFCGIDQVQSEMASTCTATWSIVHCWLSNATWHWGVEQPEGPFWDRCRQGGLLAHWPPVRHTTVIQLSTVDSLVGHFYLVHTYSPVFKFWEKIIWFGLCKNITYELFIIVPVLKLMKLQKQSKMQDAQFHYRGLIHLFIHISLKHVWYLWKPQRNSQECKINFCLFNQSLAAACVCTDLKRFRIETGLWRPPMIKTFSNRKCSWSRAHLFRILHGKF